MARETRLVDVIGAGARAAQDPRPTARRSVASKPRADGSQGRRLVPRWVTRDDVCDNRREWQAARCSSAPNPGFSLPAYERFAPPPPPALVAARLEAATAPGDIVLDLFGRGGWVARSAIDHQRKAVSLGVDRARPAARRDRAAPARPAPPRRGDPGPRRLRASRVQPQGVHHRPLREPLRDLRPAGGPRRADLGRRRHRRGRPPHRPAPVKKHYRCPVCRDQLGGGEGRHAPADATDVRAGPGPRRRRGPRRPPRPVPGARGRRVPRRRAAGPPHAPPAGRPRRDPRPGRGRAPRGADRGGDAAGAAPRGRAGEPPRDVRRGAWPRSGSRPATSRSRAPRSGASATRGPRSRTASGSSGASSSGSRAAPGAPSRPGSATTSGASPRARRRRSSSSARPAALGALELEATHGDGAAVRARVRLALGTPPLRPVAERLAWAYHGTGWVLGREAAATLPLEPLFGPQVRPAWGWQAAAIGRSLRSAEPVLARDARIVFLLEGEGPESLVACALGGVTAGYRMAAARLPEAGRETGGVVELVPPGSGAIPGGPRTRANVGPPDGPGRRRRPRPRAHRPPVRRAGAPAGRAVLGAGRGARRRRRRGRGAQAPRRARDVRRAARRDPRGPGPDGPPPAPRPAARPPRPGEADDRRRRDPPTRRSDGRAPPPPSPPTTSERLLALVRGALAGTEGRRLVRLGDDRWWLGDADGPRPRRRPARGPRRVGRVQPALDRRAPLRGRVPRPDRGPVRRPRPPRRGARPRLPRLLPQPRQHPRPAVDGRRPRPAQRGAHAADRDARRPRPPDRVRVLGRRAPAAAAGRRLDRSRDRLEDRELAGPPSLGRIAARDLEDVDVLWYVRGRSVLAWEVEWTAMLSDTVLRRHARIPPDDRLVRFLVVLPERAELVRHKLDRSPLLRDGARGRRLAPGQGQPRPRVGVARRGLARPTSSRSWASTPPSSGPATSCRCSAAEPPRRRLRGWGTLSPRPASRRPRAGAVPARHRREPDRDRDRDRQSASTTSPPASGRTLLALEPTTATMYGDDRYADRLRRPRARGPGRDGGSSRERAAAEAAAVPEDGPVGRGPDHPRHARDRRRARRSRSDDNTVLRDRLGRPDQRPPDDARRS